MAVSGSQGLRGTCREASEALVACHPELKLVRGHYECPIWGSQPHWWCVAPDGTVVDPTVEQFPSNGFGAYIPWDESKKEPTGKCLNCGDYVYGDPVCSDDCGKMMADILNSKTSSFKMPKVP